MNALENYIWFNGKIDRLDAEKLLKHGNSNVILYA